MNKLEKIRRYTTIVVDTGDIDAIKQFSPTDATTNPSLILKATSNPEYQHLMDDAYEYGKSKGAEGRELLADIMDRLYVNFGTEILNIVPGRVSTEVDARLSFNKEGSIEKAHRLISLYKEKGVEPHRILIKLASTWEGAQACQVLENEGIHCNMTLMFSLAQAIECAKANATLISPFVGRILDWFKKNTGVEGYPPTEDPGVKSVSLIYSYYKKFGIKTQVMGASFRNPDQITELAGCDLLTISPKLMQVLSEAEGEVPRKLDPEDAKKSDIQKIELDEKTFRWMLNENQMATEKLSDGIRKFAADGIKLENHIIDKYNLDV